jgi:hypothetical protein
MDVEGTTRELAEWLDQVAELAAQSEAVAERLIALQGQALPAGTAVHQRELLRNLRFARRHAAMTTACLDEALAAAGWTGRPARLDGARGTDTARATPA